MTLKDIKAPADYAELSACLDLAYWAINRLSKVAYWHYGVTGDEQKPLYEAQTAISRISRSMAAEKITNDPEHKQDWIDVIYGCMPYYTDHGPLFWMKHDEMVKLLNLAGREL